MTSELYPGPYTNSNLPCFCGKTGMYLNRIFLCKCNHPKMTPLSRLYIHYDEYHIKQLGRLKNDNQDLIDDVIIVLTVLHDVLKNNGYSVIDLELSQYQQGAI